MKRLSAILLFLLPVLVFGQPVRYGRPHVVKDNIACLYGLKNDSGQWIVPATYESLRDNYSFYLAGNRDKQGCFNKRGKLILPVIYDNIQALNNNTEPDLFISAKGSKYGVLDSSGNTIFPFEYDKITYVQLAAFPHRYFILEKAGLFSLVDNQGKTIVPGSKNRISTGESFRDMLFITDPEMHYGLVDSSGIRIPPRYGKISPTQRPGLYVVKEFGNDNHSGIINLDGDTLLPLLYTDIVFSGKSYSRVVAAKQNTFGVFDQDFHTIIPDNTQYVEGYDYSYAHRLPYQPGDTIPARRGKKWGLLRGDGTWVTEQVYDSIIYPDYRPQARQLRFIVKQNGKYGTLGPQGRILFPVEYDMLVQVSDLRTYSSQSGCIVESNTEGTCFFIGEKGGHYGATASDGKIFIPYVYDTIICENEYYYSQYSRSLGEKIYNEGNLYFTGQAGALYLEREHETHFYSTTTFPYKLSLFFKANENVLVYRNNYRYFAMQEMQQGKKKTLIPAKDIEVIGDPNNGDIIDVCFGRRDTLFFDQDGKPKKNPLQGFNIVGKIGNNRIIRNSENKLGVVSPQGKIVLAPVYYGLQPEVFSDGKMYLWTKSSNDTSCKFYQSEYNACACGWRLCNLSGKPLCPELFDFPVTLQSELETMFVNGKAGLFSISQMRFVVPPRYLEVIRFYEKEREGYSYDSDTDPGLFYVLNENHEFGLVDSKGHWVSDSTFDYMVPYPRRNDNLVVGESVKQFSRKRWMLVGGSRQAMIDGKGKITRDPALIDSLLLQSFITEQYESYRYGNFGRTSTPFYQLQGPEVSVNQYVPPKDAGPSFRPEKDSLYIESLRFANRLLMNDFGYMFQQQPGNGYRGCRCFSETNDDGVFSAKLYEAPKSQNRLASVEYTSEKGISLVLDFNPDTSAHAKNNAPPYYLNFIRKDKAYIPVTLDSIFCPSVEYKVVLNKLLTEAIAHRDNLNLDCGDPRAYFDRTYGRFMLGKAGLEFAFDQGKDRYHGNVMITVPWTALQAYSRPGGVVDVFLGKTGGEHCRPAYDTSTVDWAGEKFITLKNLLQADFLQKNQASSYRYIVSDSTHRLSGIRFCCAGKNVYDVYFEESDSKAESAETGLHPYATVNIIPKNIQKRKLRKMYRIEHYPCQ